MASASSGVVSLLLQVSPEVLVLPSMSFPLPRGSVRLLEDALDSAPGDCRAIRRMFPRKLRSRRPDTPKASRIDPGTNAPA